jgi:tetratricopeptide (TPR) repeat protein
LFTTLFLFHEKKSEHLAMMSRIEGAFADVVDQAAPSDLFDEFWSALVTMRAKREFRNDRFDEAERLQRHLVDIWRKRVAAREGKPLSNREVWGMHEGLGIALTELARTRCAKGERGGIDDLLESYECLIRLPQKGAAAVTAICLSEVYLHPPPFYSPDDAERWAKAALNLAASDRMMRGQAHLRLAQIAFEQGEVVWERVGRPREFHPEVEEILQRALRHCTDAFEALPKDDYSKLLQVLTVSAHLHVNLQDFNAAFRDYNEAIRLAEHLGRPLAASTARAFAARMMRLLGRKEDALSYIDSAISTARAAPDASPEYVERLQRFRKAVEGQSDTGATEGADDVSE